MAVRQFNGSSDWIDFTLPANITGASTVLAVVRRTSDTSGWSSIYSHVNSAGTDGLLTFELEGSTGHQGGLSLDSGGNFAEQFSTTFLTADGWGIIGYSSGGAATPVFHISKNGAAFSHTAGGANVAIPATQAGGKLTVGRFLSGGAGSDFAALKIAAIWFFNGTALANATVDGLLAKTKTDFISAGATAGWELSQASTGTSVPDLVGAANQSGISGTTVVTGDDPPSGVYTLTGGAAATSLLVPRRRSRTRGLIIR